MSGPVFDKSCPKVLRSGKLVYTSAYERFVAHVKKHSASVTSRKKKGSETEQTTEVEDKMAEAGDMYNDRDIETGPVEQDETEEMHDQDEDEHSEAGSIGTGTAAGRSELIEADTEAPREPLSTTVGLGASRRATAEVYRLHAEALAQLQRATEAARDREERAKERLRKAEETAEAQEKFYLDTMRRRTERGLKDEQELLEQRMLRQEQAERE
jgi:hypothetical protein